MSSSGFKSLVWLLRHKEFCLFGALAQGLQEAVFLRVWSGDHRDQNLWGEAQTSAFPQEPQAILMSTEVERGSPII